MKETEFKFAKAENDPQTPIEGFLGMPEDAKLLFILKEPHAESQDGFWFKRVVDGEEDNGKRYLQVLGRLAKFILNGAEDFEKVLTQCAYINLYPYAGKNKAEENDGYCQTLKVLQGTKKPGDKGYAYYKTIADSRQKLIHALCANGIQHIVTVRPIYNLLSEKEAEHTPYLRLPNKRRPDRPFIFKTCPYAKNTKLWEF